MDSLLLNYSFNVEINVETGEGTLTIYDKYGTAIHSANVLGYIAQASEETQIEYIEYTYSEIIQNLIKGDN